MTQNFSIDYLRCDFKLKSLPMMIIVFSIVAISCGPTGPPPPKLSSSQISRAVNYIRDYPEVRGAAIKQSTSRPENLSLVIVVDYGTSEKRGEYLGNHFAYMVKYNRPSKHPYYEIGQGQYSYLIGVYYPNEEELTTGVKARTNPRIRW